MLAFGDEHVGDHHEDEDRGQGEETRPHGDQSRPAGGTLLVFLLLRRYQPAVGVGQAAEHSFHVVPVAEGVQPVDEPLLAAHAVPSIVTDVHVLQGVHVEAVEGRRRQVGQLVLVQVNALHCHAFEGVGIDL